MPDTFIDFKKQRFRWAYGAIQIIKRHTASLIRGKDTELTRGQRYHFLAGWLPWVADGMNIFFTVGALLWSAAMIIVPTRVDPPLLISRSRRWRCLCSKSAKSSSSTVVR